jgi:hypothetical protein
MSGSSGYCRRAHPARHATNAHQVWHVQIGGLSYNGLQKRTWSINVLADLNRRPQLTR